MNLLKFFYKKGSLHRKILEIKEEMEYIIFSIYNKKNQILYFGAYDIDPKHLVFWICVESDEIKMNLKNDENLLNKLKQVLVKYDYPLIARDSVIIDFESQETVNRVSEGNWHIHLK